MKSVLAIYLRPGYIHHYFSGRLMHQKRKTRAYRWFHGILKLSFGNFLKWRYRLEAVGLADLESVPGPWLVLPNHVMTWDPVLISLFIREPVYFIASDANFRNPVASWWLRRLGAIPTSKQATDLTTVKQMLSLLKQGRHVGLFPEGERTWDGVTLPIIPATAKLVRLARRPVVVPVIKGGYLSLPRWSFKSRRGPISIEYKLAISAEELPKLSLQEIQEKIEKALFHDEHEYQNSQNLPYIAPAPAEPLQLVLFSCPECRNMNCMEGTGNLFRCRNCGFTTAFSAYGRFRPVNGYTTHFESISRWADWQNNLLREKVDEMRNGSSPETPLFHDEPVNYATGYKFKSLKHQAKGRLLLNALGIEFHPQGGRPLQFPWSEIRALNVVYQNQLEFYYRNSLQVFTFPGKDTSGYKYLAAGKHFLTPSE